MSAKNISNNLDMVSIKLVKEIPLLSSEKIESPEAAVRILGEMMCELDRETIFVLNLNTACMPLNGTMVSMGDINSSIMTPREVFKASILASAAQIILLHNHPSGNLTPSRSDVIATDRLIKAGTILGIPVIDHIIVGGDNRKFFSFQKQGILNSANINLIAAVRDLDFKQRPEDILDIHERNPSLKCRDIGLER